MSDELSERRKLCERFAVAITGNAFLTAELLGVIDNKHPEWDSDTRMECLAHVTGKYAQAYAAEAMKRRGEDAKAALAEGAEALTDEYDGGSEFEAV